MKTEPAREVAMFPGAIEMVVRVVRASIMSDPLAIGVDVRSFAVSGHVAECTMFRGRLCREHYELEQVRVQEASRRRSVRHATRSALRKSGNGKQQQRCKKADEISPAHLRR
jgi:hypothetical protein